MAIKTEDRLELVSGVAKALPVLEHLARHTTYEPRDHSAFMCRDGFEDRIPVDDEDLDALLTQLRVEKAIQGFRTDPNILYGRAVVSRILDDLEERGAITRREFEELDYAVRLASEDGAKFVARKWLIAQDAR